MQLTNYKKNTVPNSVRKASGTLRITKEDLEKHGPILVECAFFEKDNREHWTNLAGKEYMSKEGKKKNWNMVRWETANTTEMNELIRGLFKHVDADVSEDLPF